MDGMVDMSGPAAELTHVSRMMNPTLVHPNEILDGALIGDILSCASAKLITYDMQNSPVIKQLYKEHGKTINFAGVILATQAKLKNAQITHTIVCGDNFMNTHTEEAIEESAGLMEGLELDLFLAGPAFMAGRYGVNCGVICKYVRETYHVPAITCMYEENPGVDMYKKDMYILKGGDSARALRKDAAKMTELANKIIQGEALQGAEAEGYFGRGVLKQVFYEGKKPSAERAVEMLIKKLAGETFHTELKIEQGERVPVAKAIQDMSKIKFALITSGGIVPVDNPDRIPSASATAWGKYDISLKDLFVGGRFKTVHAGYDPSYADANPNVIVPVDIIRDMVAVSIGSNRILKGVSQNIWM